MLVSEGTAWLLRAGGTHTYMYALRAAVTCPLVWHGLQSNGRYAVLCVSVGNSDNLQVKVVAVADDDRVGG